MHSRLTQNAEWRVCRYGYQGDDRVIGARDGSSQASFHRDLANKFCNMLTNWMPCHKVRDLTSGFRAVRVDKFRQILHLLPNGFSYPTSSMVFFHSAYPAAHVTTPVTRRVRP